MVVDASRWELVGARVLLSTFFLSFLLLDSLNSSYSNLKFRFSRKLLISVCILEASPSGTMQPCGPGPRRILVFLALCNKDNKDLVEAIGCGVVFEGCLVVPFIPKWI